MNTEAIVKKYGEEAIRRLGDDRFSFVPVIPTGSLRLDIALGVGGIPRGRVTEIFGQYLGGKTTLCQHIVAECQKLGGVAAIVDAEQALDRDWAACCGVDVDELFISQPASGEMALGIVGMLIGEADLVVVDSVDALTPKAMLEGEIGDAHMARRARLMGQALRIIVPKLGKSNTALVFTNQMRTKIGVMFGSPYTTSGGEALKYYSSVRIQTRKRGEISEGDESVGVGVLAAVKKNKVAAPFRTAGFEIRFDEGISRVSELLSFAEQFDLVEKKGSWRTVFPESEREQKVQGDRALRELFKSEPDLLDALERQVRLAYGLPLRR